MMEAVALVSSRLTVLWISFLTTWFPIFSTNSFDAKVTYDLMTFKNSWALDCSYPANRMGKIWGEAGQGGRVDLPLLAGVVGAVP